MNRVLRIVSNVATTYKKDLLEQLIKEPQNRVAFKDRNLTIQYREGPGFRMKLFGYDGEEKYSTTYVNQQELEHIYDLIDDMPIRRIEMAERLSQSAAYIASLYSDDNPEETLKGTGFKDANKAKQTLELVKDRDSIYQFQVINTMYNRAKYHPHRTKEMESAMKIFKRWLRNYKKGKDAKK